MLFIVNIFTYIVIPFVKLKKIAITLEQSWTASLIWVDFATWFDKSVYFKLMGGILL